MKTILLSCWMEAKICFTRDFLLIFLYSLIIFFSQFTDFPFQPQAVENLDSVSELSTILIGFFVFLAVFSSSIFRDLDDREYYNQHPLNYQQHFIGKCIYISLVCILISLTAFLIPLFSKIYYSSALVSFSISELTNSLSTDLSSSLFTTGIILLAALFRPFHYVLLISLVSAFFYLPRTYPSIKHLLPSFEIEPSTAIPYLIYAPIFWLLGMYLFEYRMIQSPKQKKSFLIKKSAWLKKIYAFKWLPIAITVSVIVIIFRLANSQMISEMELDPFTAARGEFMQSVYQIKNQNNQKTAYFSFNFQTRNQWIYQELSVYADSEWELLHKEFSIPFDKQAPYKLDVFIKTSQKHQLGSTRGSFIVINAETINSSANKKQTLKKVFRHELTHVLINQLSQYLLSSRTDIMGNFLHEGLATLVDHHWNPNDTQLIQEAALHVKTFDQTLFEIIPKLNHFGDYDYSLNYSLGYVFWGEFVKIYGQQKIQVFLTEIGVYSDEAHQFKGVNYLFHKSKRVDIDLFKVFHATRLRLDSSFKNLDQPLINETQNLKHFKVARLNQNELLIPYSFKQPNHVFCLFRNKSSFLINTEMLQEKNYSGRMGGQCKIPEGIMDEVQIHIQHKNGISFYSPWIKVPEL